MSIASIVLFFASAFAQSDHEYRIGADDVVDVVVHGQNFERTEFKISPKGKISFPYVGQVDLSGLTAVEAQTAIEDALRGDYLVEPQVTLVVKDYGAKVHVLGAVDKEGPQTLSGNGTTLREVLSAAGIGAAGAGAKITHKRTDGSASVYALGDLQGSDGSKLVRAGDTVEVDVGFSVFLTGEVAKPGAIKFTEGITVSQALIRAGGNTEFARLAGAYVVRNGEPTKVNLRRILKGKESDFVLQPGDRVVVPVSAL